MNATDQKPSEQLERIMFGREGEYSRWGTVLRAEAQKARSTPFAVPNVDWLRELFSRMPLVTGFRVLEKSHC